jgi:hypothetical protein
VGRKQHPRRANPTLRGAVLDKGLLQWRLEAFYRYDMTTFDLADRDETAVDDLSVNQNRAGTALSFTTSLFGARVSEILA